MSDVTGPVPRWRLGGWRNRLISSRGFQRWASHFPLTRRIARKEGEALFDLVSGFVYSQVLLALVELDVLSDLRDGPGSAQGLALKHGIAPERMAVLLNAGVALKLLKKRRDRYRLAQRGAALLGVPGLEAMIRHHGTFYRDLEDPVALLKGEGETELAAFWPYVFGAGAAEDPETARIYSDLMADSQGLVAEDTLKVVKLGNVARLLDVGGGSGAFLAAVGAAYPQIELTLFDLPAVVPQSEARLQGRAQIVSGSFRDDPLPGGHDAISLIRVLYDHSDDTVGALLAKVYTALPDGGRLIISEPMTGGARPHAPGDAYFAFYCMAMQTGRARSPQEIAALCADAGFAQVQQPRVPRPFVTSVVTAVKEG